MLLAVDVGNTNLVFALVSRGEIKARWRIATDPRRTADEYAVWLHQLIALEGYSRGDVEGVALAAAVPEPTEPAPAVALTGFHGNVADVPSPAPDVHSAGVDAAAFALSLPRALAGDGRLIDALVQAARRAVLAAAEMA